jgi:subtilisin family serine protease
VTVAGPATAGLAAGSNGTGTSGTGSSGAASSGTALHPRQLPKPVATHGRRAAPQYAADHVLVRFKTGTSTARQTAGVRAAGGIALRSTASAGSYSRVATTDVVASLRRLKTDPTVAWAGYDYVRHATRVPTDPGYSASYQKPYLDLVRLPQAWDFSTGSLSQVVAVVDTGVDSTATDLAGRVLAGEHFLGGTGLGAPGGAPGAVNPVCADPSATGHGTFVASVAAADTNNGYGLAGAAWNARILPVRVLDTCGSGYDSDVSAGVTWAADHGATVINLSLGGTDPSPAIQTAMQYANGKGIPVVVSAGNDGNSVPQYPAAYPEAIAVGATDSTGELTSFSSFGDWVDLAAPGWDIVGEEPRALCADATTPNPSDCYYIGAGTSFAAPLVSGVTALLRTKFPSWSPDQIRTRLELTSRDFGPAGLDPYFGYGVLDAYAALGGSPNGSSEVFYAHYDEPATATTLSPGSTYYIGGAGRSGWYTYSNPSDVSATVAATPLPVTGGASRDSLAGQLSLMVRVYDSSRHLIGTSAPVADGAAASVVVNLPAGTDLIEIANSNGSSPGYNQQFSVAVTPHAPTSIGPPGPLNWVENMTPQDQDCCGAEPTLTVQPTITFDRAMDPSTLTSASVVLRNGHTGASTPITLSYDAPTKVLTVVPVNPLVEGTAYELAVNSGGPAAPAMDQSANAMPETLNWFTVGYYQPPPVANLTGSGTPWGAFLSWDHPVNGDFVRVDIRYVQGTTPPVNGAGTLGYSGSLDGATVSGLVAGHDYSFTALAYAVNGFSTTSMTLRGSTTTLSASPAVPTYGGSTTVTAKVRTTDGQPSAGRSVSFYSRRTSSGTGYTAIGTGTTDANGQASIVAKPAYNTDFYAVDVGGPGKMGSTATLAVPVHFSVSVGGATTTVRAGGSIHFGGVITPARPGSTVQLQGFWAGTWHLLSTTTVNSASRYAFTVVLPRRSIYIYRAVKPGDAYLAYGVSSSFTVTAT